ncbi:hypothetical protein RvY_11271 [Ramazzottius varieornatus]|uniref:Uncharacterized protein n=1 Tax=Ramazzottius varieornatus TaxID=947166 RepID=A0A1D1VFM2_RAMVA|nr:hypothetical protein RvY_11271 [Ramazzottius varieornatus]
MTNTAKVKEKRSAAGLMTKKPETESKEREGNLKDEKSGTSDDASGTKLTTTIQGTLPMRPVTLIKIMKVMPTTTTPNAKLNAATRTKTIFPEETCK